MERGRAVAGGAAKAASCLGLAVVLALAPATARAGDESGKSSRPKIRAAASVVPSGSTPAELELASGLTEILIATLSAKGRYLLVGSFEFNSALDVEKGGDAISCARDKICLGNAAARLGIKKLFAGVVGAASDGTITLNLNLVDVATFKIDRSTIVEAANTDKLFEKVPEAVDLLLRKVRPANLKVKVNIASALVVLDDTIRLSGPVANFDDVTPGEHRVKVTKEGYGEVARTMTISEGEDKELEVELLPTGVSSRPVVLRWWFLTGVGVLVAGGTTALVLFLTADRIPADVPVFNLM
jgi:hypothetical protein